MKSTLLHWWTSATPQKYEYKLHPGECSQEQSQAWKFWNFLIGAIINEVVDGCHQWKVARMNSKSSSSTSTIIEYFGKSYMNSDKSWIMNYGSLLREKEENFDTLCLRIFTACRGISRVRLTRFKQRWNEDESSSVHRETIAFTMRVKPNLLEKHQRQQGRRQHQSRVNTSENKVLLQKK